MNPMNTVNAYFGSLKIPCSAAAVNGEMLKQGEAVCLGRLGSVVNLFNMF